MTELNKNSGPADKKLNTNLHDACVKLQEHIATLIKKELHPTIFDKGLAGVKLTLEDKKSLQKIAHQESISDADIKFVISKVSGSAPSGEFIAKHPRLAEVLEKYSALTDLLRAKDDVEFRNKYRFHINIIKQTSDLKTESFLSAVSEKLTGGHYNFKYVGEATADKKKNDAVPTQSRTPKVG